MAKTIKLADVVPSRFAHLTPANDENIERIREDLVNGSKVMLNEPHVFREGNKYELLAGHDRVEAARRAGWKEIQVREFVTLNTDDAILAHFCKENLLRKDISKAAIAGQWLKSHPDWSDGKVAAESGCTPVHVGETRAELVAAGKLVSTPNRLGVDGRTRQAPAEPRQPKRGPLASKKPTPTKPKYESAAEMADALTRRQPPKLESGAEKEAPEVKASTGAAALIQPEVGTDRPAPRSAEILATQKSDTAPATSDAAGASSRVTPEGPDDAPVTDDSVGASTSLHDPAVREGGASFVLTVLAALPVHLHPPMTDDLAPLTKGDVDRLLSAGRWCQAVAARWHLLQKQTAAA